MKLKHHNGVAQGRNSSPDLYSFYVSDMARCTNDLPNNDYMDPYNLAQLADDTIIMAEYFQSIIQKFRCLFKYSRTNYQVPNVDKTVFCHFTQNHSVISIKIDENTTISCVNSDKGHRYLGIKFIPTNNFDEIIKFNWKDRKGRMCKFYAWLEDNEETHIQIEILVETFVSQVIY